MRAKKAILVAEGDSQVRRLLYEVLAGDYKVLLAADGLDAMHCYERHAARIAAVITGVQMPRVNGVRFVEWLRRQNALVPVVVITGGPGQADLDGLLWSPAMALLPKPFDLDELAEVLRGVTAGAGEREREPPPGRSARTDSTRED